MNIILCVILYFILDMDKEILRKDTNKKCQNKLRELLNTGKNKLKDIFSPLRHIFIKKNKKEIIDVLNDDTIKKEPHIKIETTTEEEHTPTQKPETTIDKEESNKQPNEPIDSNEQPTINEENTIQSQINECLENCWWLSEKTIDLIKIRLNEILENNNINDVYAEWSEWKIYKIEINENWKKKQYLIAKKRYDNTYKSERDIHKLVQSLLPIGNNVVKIPELKAIFNIKKSNYIIMEFIEWKTLYTLIVEKILQKLLWDSNINIENDRKADAMFQKYCKMASIQGRDKIDKFFESEAKKIKLFSPKEWKKYEQSAKFFFDELHKKWVYHRDVHWKNVILWNDWKLYVIDFGKATLADDEYKAYRESSSDEISQRYSYDSRLESEMWNATYSEEEWECLQESKVTKEKIKIINNSDSIIDIIWDSSIPKDLLPKKWRGTMSETTFKEEIKKIQKLGNKNIRLKDLLDSTVTDRNILCFVQSIENLNDLLSKIEIRLHAIEKQLSTYKKDLRAEQTLFKKNNITPLEKDKKWLIQIRNYLTELKSFIEKSHPQTSDTNLSDN